MSKRFFVGHFISAVVLCIMSALLLTGCHNPWKSTSYGPAPTSSQLLTSVQKNFTTVNSFHVSMQVQNPGPANPNQIQIHSANGDVIMPDKVKAQATVMLSGQAVTVNLISIANNQFITDPVTGQWRVVKGVLDPRTLTNPHTGLVSVISKVQNVTKPVSDSVNGAPCWRIQGQLDAKYLAFFTGGGVPDGTMLQTNACIGKSDSLPYQVAVTGQAASGDTAQTTRTFIMSNYNENITIAPPQI